MDRPSKTLKFEQAIEQIETIIDRIESGESGLEQSMLDFEHGMKLLTRCRAILDRAEQRIAELTADAAGHLHVSGDSAQLADDNSTPNET